METLQEIVIKLLTLRFIVSGIALVLLLIVLSSMGWNLVFLLIIAFFAVLIGLIIILGRA